MPNPDIRNRPKEQAATDAVPAVKRDDDLLDAVATASAIVACADGRIEPVERDALVDFMARNGFLCTLTRAEILEAFERRLEQLEEDGGVAAAVDSLERFAGQAPARLAIDVSKQVAAANGYLHAREIHVLQRIHIALGAPSTRSLNSARGAR